MSRTMRKLPEWAKNVDWICPQHKVNNFRFSGVRYLKGDCGNGKNPGWQEADGVKVKRIGKKIARKIARRNSKRLERNYHNI